MAAQSKREFCGGQPLGPATARYKNLEKRKRGNYLRVPVSWSNERTEAWDLRASNPRQVLQDARHQSWESILPAINIGPGRE